MSCFSMKILTDQFVKTKAEFEKFKKNVRMTFYFKIYFYMF